MSHTLELLTMQHGTVAGYRAGCRTSAACQSDPSCLVVHTRYVGDYGFSKRVDAGEIPAVIFAEEAAQRDAVRARDTAADRAARGAAAKEQRDRERARIQAAKPRRETIAEKHGADIIRLAAEGLSDRVIAERLGIRLSTIGTARRRLGAVKPPRVARPREVQPPRYLQRRERVRALHGEGKTDQQIADELGSSRTAIAATRRKLGLPVNAAERRRTERIRRQPRIDHTADVVRLHTEGMTERQIAKDIGCSQTTVNRIRRGLGLPVNRPRRAPRPDPATLQPHGTNACYARGCRLPECVEAHKAYHREYAKRRKAEGPREYHGTAYGYQLGCRSRSDCPAATSCTDAMLEADRARRRAAGIPAKELVDAAPVREHVRDLNNAGMPFQQVADAAGVPFASVKSLMFSRGKDRPRVDSLLAERATALLSVPIPEGATA